MSEMSRLMTKPTNWHVHPAKTQISLGIRPVWSESSLCAQWVAKDPTFLHADSEDSDRTGRMPRLIWVFAVRTCHFVGFVMRRLKWFCWDVKPNPLLFKHDLFLRLLKSWNQKCFNWAASWENLFLPYANNKGADQPSLISAFLICCWDSIILLVSISKISSLSLSPS